MTTTELLDAWIGGGDTIVQFASDQVQASRLSSIDKAALELGLPEDAAPFLSFGARRNGKVLLTVSELWRLPPEFDDLIVIGGNGSGDPVCIDVEDGSVVYLSHDNEFQIVLINSSLQALVQSLLGYRELVREARTNHGDDAFLENNVPSASIEAFADLISQVDREAASPGTFWGDRIEDLRRGPDAV